MPYTAKAPTSDFEAPEEIFIDGLSAVDPLMSGVFRFTFFRCVDGVIVPRVYLVAPPDAVPPALILVAKRVLGLKLAVNCYGMPPTHLH